MLIYCGLKVRISKKCFILKNASFYFLSSIFYDYFISISNISVVLYDLMLMRIPKSPIFTQN